MEKILEKTKNDREAIDNSVQMRHLAAAVLSQAVKDLRHARRYRFNQSKAVDKAEIFPDELMLFFISPEFFFVLRLYRHQSGCCMGKAGMCGVKVDVV